jgi:hypothetical protein
MDRVTAQSRAPVVGVARHLCGISLMVKQQISNLRSRVRFSYPAPSFRVISSAVESLPYTQFVGSSILSSPTSFFGVWRSLASAPGLGPGGPRFESLYSDQSYRGLEKRYLGSLISFSWWFDSIIRNHLTLFLTVYR